MKKFIEDSKTLIPTWVICVFMFCGIFGWTFLIGLILTIIQYFQIKKIRKNNNINENECEIISNDKFKQRNFLISSGTYKGGKDFPIGIYDISLVWGKGYAEIDVPDCIFMDFTKKRNRYNGYVNEYKNISISDKSILKIDDNLKIRMKLISDYDFSIELSESIMKFNNQKTMEINNIKNEINNMKQEMEILNHDLIRNYYIFSDYEHITSQECKNRLLFLKIKEKDMRDKGTDIFISRNENRSSKTDERIIRQMLRTFNSECDNILYKIAVKNIDSCINKIQKSFETINKLYSIDSAELTNDLLELKIEQATSLYTYELKAQQEKEIQKSIKEQMIEEAKAQKELEVQKRKIEKDLQQHVGEVNRLMKYLQKSQNDIEKELYADKIKELEQKIKELENERETVIQREENNKAGFVYVISNIGSFGEDIYKIGMTRRLEPMDRIKELSSASVPFEFDVHAMIFSSNAPELENELHKYFSDKAVNKVNPRKEFFKVNIDEIEKVVKENYNETVQFTKIPIASEYYQSISPNERKLISNNKIDKFDLSEKLKEKSSIINKDNLNKNIFKKDILKERNDDYMYDKEKGIYPSGQYLVGRDIPLGSYVLNAKKDYTAFIQIYPSYQKYKDEEDEITYDSFVDDYHISLIEENTYLVVENAEIKKI